MREFRITVPDDTEGPFGGIVSEHDPRTLEQLSSHSLTELMLDPVHAVATLIGDNSREQLDELYVAFIPLSSVHLAKLDRSTIHIEIVTPSKRNGHIYITTSRKPAPEGLQ